MISGKDIAPYSEAMAGFKSMVKANITEYSIPSVSKESKKMAKAIRSRTPDLILAIGINAALLAKEEFRDIPVVYCMVMYPEKYDFATAIRNNLKGISLKISVKDQMVALRSIIPELKRVGIIYNPYNTEHLVKEAENILKNLGVDLVTEKINSGKLVPEAFRKLLNKGIDVYWLTADPTVVTIDSFRFLLVSAFDNNIPLMAYSEKFVEAGALLSLSPDYFSIGKQAAGIANEFLEGSNSASTPVICPDVVNLVINITTAKRINIVIPAELLKSAKKVFKLN